MELLDFIKAEIPIISLIESALGVRNFDSIATSPCVKVFGFGELDMSLDLGLRNRRGREFALDFFD